MPLLLLLLVWSQAIAGTLMVDVLDVGQGDSILIRTPAGKTILIDAGTPRAPVPRMLAARGIEGLDLVIATHGHADHIGSMARVLTQVPVRLYGDQGMPHTTATYTRVMQRVEEKEIRYLTLRAGRVFKLDDGIKLEVIGPNEPLLSGTRSDLNSNSVVTRLTHGANCFLFMGDAEDPTEGRLIAADLEPCNVLKVAHHGSAHSSSSAWLAAVQPDIALISAGKDNRYKHPNDGTLLRIEHAGAKIYRTDLMGTIRVTSDKKKVSVKAIDEKALLATLAPPAPASPKPGTPAVARGPLPPQRVPVVHAQAGADRSDAPSFEGFLNVNRADAEQLQTLPGIGPSKANAIIDFRNNNGPFVALADLDSVPGIGPATLAKLSDRVRFGPPPRSKAANP